MKTLYEFINQPATYLFINITDWPVTNQMTDQLTNWLTDRMTTCVITQNGNWISNSQKN
jgi:hypothetical protein